MKTHPFEQNLTNVEQEIKCYFYIFAQNFKNISAM